MTQSLMRSVMKTIATWGLFRGSSGSLALETNHDAFRIFTDALDPDNAGCLDQIGKARKAVVARVEVRRLFRQMRANTGEIGAPVFVGGGRHRLGEHIERRAIQGCFRRRGFGRRRLWCGGGFRVLPFTNHIEHVEINKLVASGDERAGRLAFPKTIDGDALLTDASGEASKVAVARDDAEAGEATGIQ